MTRATAVCGTYAGLQRHQHAHEPVCPECRAAGAGYVTGWRHRIGGARHGTQRTLLRHLAAGETPCGLCQGWLNGFAGAVAKVAA